MPSKQTGTRVLIEQVCTNKDTLILIFEELFGKEQATEMLASNKLGGKESLAQKIRTESGNTMKKIDTVTQKARYPQSLASTNEASEVDRIQRIMNDPIENLIMASKSYNELRIGKVKKNRNITTAPPLKTRHKAKI